MKQWLKRISGIEAKERELEEERARVAEEVEVNRAHLEAAELELLKKKDPKA
jgi:hypothetical protein